MNATGQALPVSRLVNLKLLYTFDDKNTFLARSSNPLLAKIISLPSQPPHNGAQVGVIGLRDCLDLLQLVSPEWFQKGMDYSIYFKDIVEVGEPYVGTGLCSRILSSKNSDIMITGRLSTGVINIYQSNTTSDTLDIRLRLSPICSISSVLPSNKRKLDSISDQVSSQSFSTCNNSNTHQPRQLPQQQPQQQQQQQQTRKKVKRQTANSKSSNKSKPELAFRTQSLPFITPDSLAHRIRIADSMISTRVDEEIDANGEPISSRFSNFRKIDANNMDNQPTKARKSTSFIESVVKIGDNAVVKSKKSNLKNLPTHECINCSITSNPPYKFYKEGIFQLGNAGYLCCSCNKYHMKNDVKALRERGELGVKGLLDGPYSKSTSNNSNIGRKKRSSNLNSSSSALMEHSSSSPIFLTSSPMTLQNRCTNRYKSKKQNTTSHVNKTKTIQEVNTLPGDFMDILKYGNALPNQNQSQNQRQRQGQSQSQSQSQIQVQICGSNLPSDQNHIEKLFKVPGNIQLGVASSKGQSKNNTPNDELYKDFDNIPVDATKLNTTLIPLDDDEKESFLSSNFNNDIQVPHPQQPNNGNINNTFFNSPSIQRIIESFSNEPSSPTKSNAEHWDYNFFEQNTSQYGVINNDNTECDDPEINRILSATNIEKYEITPRDPGTSNTQQNGDETSCRSHGSTPASESTNYVAKKTDTATDSLTNNNEHLLGGNSKEAIHPENKNMPSSPFFSFQADDVDRTTKSFDSNTLMNWDTKSSPITDQLTSCDPK